MARITVDDCLKRISNRFQLTLAATYPARQRGAGASPLVEPNRDKVTVIALREIATGKIGVEVLKRNATPAASLGLEDGRPGCRRSKTGSGNLTPWRQQLPHFASPTASAT